MRSSATALAPVTALAFAALLTAAGCASATPGGGTEGVDEAPGADVEETADDTATGGLVDDGPAGEEEEETVEWVFGAGEQISVELTLYSQDEGGRSTPVFSGYRPTVEFDHLGQSVTCSVQLPADVSPFEPGETHLVGLECADEVTVHVDELGFVLVEGGKENGGGGVVLTDL